MHVKLTLRIEEPLIKAAKQYSKDHDKSLSQLIADYLFLLTAKSSKKDHEEMPPLTRTLKGILHGTKVREEDYNKHLKSRYR
jgi:hypothetical protein